MYDFQALKENKTSIRNLMSGITNRYKFKDYQ